MKRYGSGRRRHGRQQPWRRRRGHAPDDDNDNDNNNDNESCGGGGNDNDGRVKEHLGHHNRETILV
jgi:hypothetical protein